MSSSNVIIKAFDINKPSKGKLVVVEKKRFSKHEKTLIILPKKSKVMYCNMFSS